MFVPSWALAPGPSLEASSVFALRLKPLGNACNEQIHEDLDVSFFAEMSEHQTSGFEWYLFGFGNPFISNLEPVLTKK
jgi:hypothetical protein